MKWCAPPSNLNLDVEKINETFAVLGDYYGQKLFVAGIQTSILTKKSALNSCRMYSHSKPIPIGTSAGYPFNQMVYNGKQHLIHVDKETGERRFTNDPELKNLLHQTIDHVLQTAKEDKLADVAFIVFPKDEPLKKDKLKTKVRTIASAPIHLSIALRMYFHTLDAALAELWPVLPLKVGIAANSLDWHALALYMLEVGDEGFSLDQADFDFNVPQEVNRGVVHTKNAIAKWTDPKWKPEHDKMRIALRENVVKFKIIVGPLVYESQRGVASGQPSTATDNTHISVFFAYDTFKDLAPSWVDNSLTAFFALVRIAAVGDDLFVMVNILIRDWYNLQTVAEHLTKKYGLKITPSDKSGTFYKTKPLEELDFLSRHFVKDGNYWKGPLKMERLLKPLHYCHGFRAHHWFEEPDKETDDMDTAIAAASSALQEMYFHGKEEYESLRKHIVTINSQVLCNTQEYFPPYEVEHQKYFNMQNYSEKGLYEYVFPTDHTIVSKLTKTKGWIKYRNRRSLIFGNYHWDTKTTGKGLDIPGYLLTLIEQVNNLLLTDFNSVLVNEYQPGGLIPWHKDDEPELDQTEGVACITIIGDGVMEWAEKKDDSMHQKITMLCFPGHCYHMCGKYVTDYYHRRSHHERYTVSLTFRKLLGSSV
ncbi:RNA-dependent RNA polymerase [Duwamo virus]|uniref:RNA-dependent RNA polymerase n=1 Tax=Duwamo virus TaxID=1888317 RepID=UPI00083F4AAB|nr:RNA-dependent RNA polymerase [Duwamo virus]AOC55074.1 RNA-dependent RNA polymerase [Duwamo virus]